MNVQHDAEEDEPVIEVIDKGGHVHRGREHKDRGCQNSELSNMWLGNRQLSNNISYLYLTSKVGKKTERTGTAKRSQSSVARAAPTRPQTAVNVKFT